MKEIMTIKPISKKVTTDAVEAHLNLMKKVYDDTKRLSPSGLYVYLSDLESKYMLKAAGYDESFCSSVHQLHPVKYKADTKMNSKDFALETTSDMNWAKWSSKCVLKCFSCNTSLSVTQAYNVHILNKSAICTTCKAVVSYEMICIRITCGVSEKTK